VRRKEREQAGTRREEKKSGERKTGRMGKGGEKTPDYLDVRGSVDMHAYYDSIRRKELGKRGGPPDPSYFPYLVFLLIRFWRETGTLLVRVRRGAYRKILSTGFPHETGNFFLGEKIRRGDVNERGGFRAT